MSDDWVVTPLGEVVVLQRGFDLPEYERNLGGVPVIGSFGITGWHNHASVKGPGVTVGRSGASMGVAFFSEHDFWPLNTALFVRDFKGNDQRFVYYLLKAIDFTSYNSGSAQPSLNRNYVAGRQVDLPPLREQRAIAEVLGALDDKIEANRSVATRATQLAITAGANLLDSDAPKRSLGDVTEIIKGVSYRSADLVPGDGWLVSLKCAGRDGSFQADGLKPFSGEAKETQVVREGDVLVAQTDLTQRGEVIGRPIRVETLGRSGRFVASLDYVIVRPRDGLTREVLFAILSQPEFRDHNLGYCNGTTVLHMNSVAVPKYAVRLPSLTAIASATSLMSALLKIADSARSENALLIAVRDTLLPRLLSGELRVRDPEALVGDAA